MLHESFLADIATCGCYPDEFSRLRLWFNWSEKQKEHALRPFKEVIKRAEDFCNLHKEHRKMLGDDCGYMDLLYLSRIFRMDCSKHYTPKQILDLIDNAIINESKWYEEEVKYLTGMYDVCD